MKRLLLALLFVLLPAFVFAVEQVDINTASLGQLDLLTGVGPAIAQRIIDARPYSSIDDLDKVKGIGPATLQKIKDQGLACVDCPAQSAKEPAAQQTSVNTAKVLPKTEKSVKNNIEEAGIADISRAINTNQEDNQKNPWFLFFTTLGFAIILASITLLIKLKIFNHVRT